MPKRRTIWTVSLAGKWGGARNVEVQASSESSARKLALQLARLDERIIALSDSGRQA